MKMATGKKGLFIQTNATFIPASYVARHPSRFPAFEVQRSGFGIRYFPAAHCQYLELIVLVPLRAFCTQKNKKSPQNHVRKVLIDNMFTLNLTKSH
jgi:hypothetical protein